MFSIILTEKTPIKPYNFNLIETPCGQTLTCFIWSWFDGVVKKKKTGEKIEKKDAFQDLGKFVFWVKLQNENHVSFSLIHIFREAKIKLFDLFLLYKFIDVLNLFGSNLKFML